MTYDNEVETPVSPEQFAADCFADLHFQVLHGTQPEYCDDFTTIMMQGDSSYLCERVRKTLIGDSLAREVAMIDLHEYCDEAIRDYLRDSEALERYIREAK